ncbi:BZ3500_MvSof-1268-A1-R1_Chr4-2g07125 [Microbotryum saponariae]|uniref:BZ3500_MvSof-1268-A1-R1_Chr4-2g07125 protein n=1 Tax=Microbotryum saponariae TaxID=289078 RepID=A0A2X0LN72_9BASI|nr:BZ3500_MvSof-1268-A1-R1_Chr4-2g07125 [Microbotryum saponariae]SDA06790.1 BZ3501_MvSof-1269-A2-R1_Chr4-2g06836 [Microbotryum saponariae]
MDRLRQVVNLLENCTPNHLQMEYDTMQAKQSRLRQWPLILGNRKKADECKLKDTRPILKLPLYIDTEERCVAVVEIRHGAPSISFFQHPANHMALIEWHPRIGENLQSTWNESRKEDKDIERECSSHLKQCLGVTLESVRKPATVMRTIARQIKVLSDYCKKWEKIHRVTRHPNRAIWAKQIKRRAYVLDVVIHTRLRCDMESEANSDPPPPPPLDSVPLALRESLLELEVKPLGSPKVEIFAPTPVLIDPSIGTMDTSHSNFDPQRTTPLVSRNPRSSPAPSSATIGLMPATPPMRLQRAPLEVVGSLSRYQRRTLAARSTIPISASAQVLANRSARGKNPLSKLHSFAQALHSMSGSQDKFNVEGTCSRYRLFPNCSGSLSPEHSHSHWSWFSDSLSSCKKRSEIVDPKPCHDE